MKAQLLKRAFAASLFVALFLGFTITQSTKKIANQDVKVSLVSFSNQAQAYCNEARYQGESNNGACSGDFGDPNTRCVTGGSACVQGE